MSALHPAAAGIPADVEAVEEIMRRGGAGLRERMGQAEAHLEDVTARAGAPLATHATATVVAGGKRLRPLLVLLAAEAAGGVAGDPEREQSLIAAAVAVELVHSATLVHDDVLDAAALRRGRPTVVAAAGREIATATGDLLFSRAFAELARSRSAEAVRFLSDASCALAEGELLQREDAWSASVTPERYLHRCDLKTARLFQAACALGALHGTPAAVEPLGRFGRRIGLAFQLLDDVLDVSGPAERTGKHRGTDLLDGTVTLPLILARERDPEIDLRGVRTTEEAAAVCDRIAATGVLEDARSRGQDLVAEAKRGLPALPLRQREALDLAADVMVERYA